jgi:para-aminobenzoate synthetase component 1
MMTPFILDIPWRAPAEGFAALAEHPFALLLESGDGHAASQMSYIAANPVQTLEIWPEDAGDALTQARAMLAPFRRAALPEGLPPFSGGLAGLASYELGARLDRLPRAPRSDAAPWPDLALGLYDCVAAFDPAQRCARIVSWGWLPDGGADARHARERAENLAAALAAPGRPHIDGAWPRPKAASTPADYAAGAARVIDYIRAGDCFQANLSQRFDGALPANATPYDLYRRLSAASAAPFSAFWRGRDLALASNSPERLVRLSAGPEGLRAEARPIKGTRPRGATPEEDYALAAALLASAKDRAENLMIVDLLRNDLARVCSPGSVKVPYLHALESFANVHHLVSTVTGRLRDGLDVFDLMRAIFPGGSITGAPKIRAAEIIAELEGEARGPYCGSLVWFGIDGAMDASILIRSVACELRASIWRTRFRTGAGIVADSIPQDEAQECLSKASAALSAFGET